MGKRIYDRPTWKIINQDMLPDLGIEGDVTFTKDQAVAWFSRRYPNLAKRTIDSHLVSLSTNDTSRRHNRVSRGDDILFRVSTGVYRRYKPGIDENPYYPGVEWVPRAPRPSYLPRDDDQRIWSDGRLPTGLAKDRSRRPWSAATAAGVWLPAAPSPT